MVFSFSAFSSLPSKFKAESTSSCRFDHFVRVKKGLTFLIEGNFY